MRSEEKGLKSHEVSSYSPALIGAGLPRQHGLLGEGPLENRQESTLDQQLRNTYTDTSLNRTLHDSPPHLELPEGLGDLRLELRRGRDEDDVVRRRLLGRDAPRLQLALDDKRR